MADEPHLLTREDNGVLIVSLNRPEKLNALSGETMQLFEAALLHFRDTDALRVMLIRANGRYFCAGADMRSGSGGATKRTATGIRENHRTGLHGMHRIYDEMEHIEKPIVAAIHSACVGGGLEMALSCDFRLAAKGASFSFPEGLFGVLPASNGVSRLTRTCGPHWARWLIMGNQKADADKAHIMGLVHDVLPDDGFDDAALAFCHHLKKSDAEQMGAAKIAIDMAAEVGRDTARHVERMANSALMLNPAYQARIEQYIKGIGSKE
ncbi:enoyl-CoA hydratase/isomerase family protein [Blastomonas fulva]|uniref:enoyl-CoA hydratase/isomerase family protein n=1 Tax=Blastomonas fulva TaxID=1550728 RepID=UPI0025A3D0D7|nr:enoyl-CoA hydratase/isomerase family protein [Blastomonas fulva]MDM7929398.1 enoyl-CoA hydratase/isomerase family protein [Blastomonas fulva]MDM7965359.1 enoyl-CoA hydratase/isomerase family protein [Blastomonas fulva]